MVIIIWLKSGLAGRAFEPDEVSLIRCQTDEVAGKQDGPFFRRQSSQHRRARDNIVLLGRPALSLGASLVRGQLIYRAVFMRPDG